MYAEELYKGLSKEEVEEFNSRIVEVLEGVRNEILLKRDTDIEDYQIKENNKMSGKFEEYMNSLNDEERRSLSKALGNSDELLTDLAKSEMQRIRSGQSVTNQTELNKEFNREFRLMCKNGRPPTLDKIVELKTKYQQRGLINPIPVSGEAVE